MLLKPRKATGVTGGCSPLRYRLHFALRSLSPPTPLRSPPLALLSSSLTALLSLSLPSPYEGVISELPAPSASSRVQPQKQLNAQAGAGDRHTSTEEWSLRDSALPLSFGCPCSCSQGLDKGGGGGVAGGCGGALWERAWKGLLEAVTQQHFPRHYWAMRHDSARDDA